MMGALYYFAYAAPSDSWTDPWLIGVALFISGFAPYYSKFSNKIDEKAAFRTASLFAGKLARFIAQVLFNVVVYTLLVQGTSVDESDLAGLGGILGISLVVSLASQGIQYLAIAFSNRDIGIKNLNVTIGVAISIAVAAMAAQGFGTAQTVLKIAGVLLALVGVFYSLFTDTRGWFAPKGGGDIGVYFGTFNPAHKTHAAILRRFIEDRQLDKVIVHPTLIPKIHRLALEKGQIEIVEQSGGMRVYEATDKADVHVNYFMTGKRFYETEHRLEMLKIMVREEGLADKVEVAMYTQAYNSKGFYGVVREIRRLHPGKRIHGLHGSDVGGMLVRSIYDECMGIIPYAVKRIDGISATAIRAGAQGMTTPGVAAYISGLNAGTQAPTANTVATPTANTDASIADADASSAPTATTAATGS